MELRNIKKSLSECSEEELREMLTHTRNERRTSKPKPTANKQRARVASKPKTEVSVNTLVDSMTPEQILLLLQKMGG